MNQLLFNYTIQIDFHIDDIYSFFMFLPDMIPYIIDVIVAWILSTGLLLFPDRTN